MAFERRVLAGRHPKTEKLFHADTNQTEAIARVLEIQDEFVVLDRTVFYAESGGQEFDTGFIDESSVIDVQDQGGRLLLTGGTRVQIPPIKVDTIVIHRLSKPAEFEVGQKVNLRIDGNRRKKLMKSHSGAHFLFHAARLILESKEALLFVKGCHITEDSFRFDFSNEITGQQAHDIVGLCNELIVRGGVMEMEQSEVSDEVFYWVWEDVVIPCGGTHIKDVSELREIKASRSKKGTNITRIKGSFA